LASAFWLPRMRSRSGSQLVGETTKLASPTRMNRVRLCGSGRNGRDPFLSSYRPARISQSKFRFQKVTDFDWLCRCVRLLPTLAKLVCLRAHGRLRFSWSTGARPYQMKSGIKHAPFRRSCRLNPTTPLSHGRICKARKAKNGTIALPTFSIATPVSSQWVTTSLPKRCPNKIVPVELSARPGYLTPTSNGSRRRRSGTSNSPWMLFPNLQISLKAAEDLKGLLFNIETGSKNKGLKSQVLPNAAETPLRDSSTELRSPPPGLKKVSNTWPTLRSLRHFNWQTAP